MFPRWLPFALLFLVASQILSAQNLYDPALRFATVIKSGTVSNLTSVVFLASDDLLVSEKSSGQVKRVINGVVQTPAVLDLAVNFDSERGLLHLVLDPEFPASPYVYLYYTQSSTGSDTSNTPNVTNNRVERYTWNGAALVNGQLLLALPATPGPNHDGGVLAFGPPTVPPAAQKLFIVLGDLNQQTQLQNYSAGAAPNGAGAILRINKDGSTPSGAERGPFFDVAAGNASLERTYAYGVRNSFGMDFDPATGTLWDSENGPGNYDEVNRVPPAFNSGWTYRMGPTARGANYGASGLVQFGGIGAYADPQFSWNATVAPTAVHFIRAPLMGPGYRHKLLVGANNSPQKLYLFDLNPARDALVMPAGLADRVRDGGDDDSPLVLGDSFGVVTDLEPGPDGALYVVTLAPPQIYRLTNTSAVHPSAWFYQ